MVAAETSLHLWAPERWQSLLSSEEACRAVSDYGWRALPAAPHQCLVSGAVTSTAFCMESEKNRMGPRAIRVEEME